jgi:hypothetical protein
MSNVVSAFDQLAVVSSASCKADSADSQPVLDPTPALVVVSEFPIRVASACAQTQERRQREIAAVQKLTLVGRPDGSQDLGVVLEVIRPHSSGSKHVERRSMCAEKLNWAAGSYRVAQDACGKRRATSVDRDQCRLPNLLATPGPDR